MEYDFYELKKPFFKLICVILTILTAAAAVTTAFSLIYRAYADNKADVDTYYGPFGVKLMDTGAPAKSVKAEAVIIDDDEYDALSGMGEFYYYWDSTPESSRSRSGTEYDIFSNGEHCLNIYASGNGNDNLYAHIEFLIDNIDNSAPEIGEIKCERKEGLWKVRLTDCRDGDNPESALSFLCLLREDAESYRNGMGWDAEGLVSNEDFCRDDHFLLPDGDYCAFAADEAGNVTEKDFSLKLQDEEPPCFTAEPQAFCEDGENGFCHSMIICAYGEDQGSGLDDFAYSFDNGNSWQESHEFRVTENGSYSVMLRDRFGNVSQAKTVDISNIDNEKPSLSLTKDEPDENGRVRISILACDEISGIAGISYFEEGVNDPTPVSDLEYPPGEKAEYSVYLDHNGDYTFAAADNAGNYATEKISLVKEVKISSTERGSSDKGSGESKVYEHSSGSGNSSKVSSTDADASDSILYCGTDSGSGSSRSSYTSSGSSGYSSTSGSSSGKSSSPSVYERSSERKSTDPGYSLSYGINSGSNSLNGSVNGYSGNGSSKTSKRSGKSGSSKGSSPSPESVAVSGDDTGHSILYALSDNDADWSLNEISLNEYYGENDSPLYATEAAEETEAGDEMMPELLKKTTEAGNKKRYGLKIFIMTLIILISLGSLTFILLYRNGLIRLPSLEETDSP